MLSNILSKVTIRNQHALQQAHARAVQYCMQQDHKQHSSHAQRQNVNDVFWIMETIWQSMQAAQWQEAYTLTVQAGLLDDLARWGSYSLVLDICQAFCLKRHGS